jgi:4'-phosphopantetheinyl transferase
MPAAENLNDSWPLPPEGIELNDNEVHVWMVRTADTGSGKEELSALLSPDERRRASHFRFDRDRRLYVAAHAGLRSILAKYLQIAVNEIFFDAGIHGKPLLAQPLAKWLDFNLSHSHEIALIAAARGRAVGIDVEFVNRDFSFEEIARRFFTASEVTALLQLPRPLQRKAFFKCWTSKEALLKAKAMGLSGQLDEVRLVLTADEAVRVYSNVPGWSLMELGQADGYEAALVVQGGAGPVRCYRWEPHSAF